MSARPALLVPAALSLLCLFTPAATPGPAAKAAAKELAKVAKLQQKQLKKSLALTTKQFELTLELIVVKHEQELLSAGAAFDEGFDAWVDATLIGRDHADGALATVEAIATGLLDDLNGVPADFRVGGDGTWDTFEGKVRQLLASSLSRLDLEMAKFQIQLGKLAPSRLHSVRRSGIGPENVGAPGTAQDSAAQAPARIVALAGSSGSGAPNDGRLRLAGVADADANSGSVSIRALGPGGESLEQSVLVDSGGRFAAFFPETGAPNLAEGNWRVVVEQGGAPSSGAIGIP